MENDSRITEYIETTLPPLLPRDRTGHKGTYGTVLGIGGSRGMAGAVALAGRAALVIGAGLVRLAVPDRILETVAGYYPEPTTLPCDADRKGRFSPDARAMLLRYAESASAVFLGPGLGRSAGLDVLVPLFLRRVSKPVVVDADALNALSAMGVGLFDRFFEDRKRCGFVLTPHPGEFARLRDEPTPPESQPDRRREAAMEFARRYGIVLVLKGHETIVTDGNFVALNPTGNPGMATGGSGDVLTGMITGLIAQGFTTKDAATLGVFLHGRAGDLAARQLGEESVTASDILQSIPSALRSVRR